MAKPACRDSYILPSCVHPGRSKKLSGWPHLQIAISLIPPAPLPLSAMAICVAKHSAAAAALAARMSEDRLRAVARLLLNAVLFRYASFFFRTPPFSLSSPVLAIALLLSGYECLYVWVWLSFSFSLSRFTYVSRCVCLLPLSLSLCLWLFPLVCLASSMNLTLCSLAISFILGGAFFFFLNVFV